MIQIDLAKAKAELLIAITEFFSSYIVTNYTKKPSHNNQNISDRWVTKFSKAWGSPQALNLILQYGHVILVSGNVSIGVN